jgi:ankyrin repeat protein
MTRFNYTTTIFLIFCLNLSACSQTTGNRNVDFFKGTKAYDLAKAVYTSDINKIEKIVKSDTSLLSFNNPTSGSNVLFLSIYVERHEALKKLLELGGNPNSTNLLTKYSLLMESITPFGSQFEWRREHQYAKLLLEYGADPNYAVEEDFTNEKGHHIMASSPLMKASNFDLEAVKLLIKYGADPNHKLKQNQSTPFSKAAQRGKVEIINYFIDSLRIDIHQPMSVVTQKPDNEIVTYYLQDYLVNKYCLARLRGNTIELERLRQDNNQIDEANKELWELIEKLEKIGIDFKNHKYKLK